MFPNPDVFPSADILREHNFNPDEPRDERGRWTTGGSHDASKDGVPGPRLKFDPIEKAAWDAAEANAVAHGWGVSSAIPRKLAHGRYTAAYRIHSIKARMEDDFDFNPGQFKSFPAKQLNDIGTAKGVPFHIFADLKGLGWNTNNRLTVPYRARE